MAWLTEDMSCFSREDARHQVDLIMYTRGYWDDFPTLALEWQWFLQKEATDEIIGHY
jgi:hypothetical protein